ncbi:hypothetical protein [Streptomyces noursei]|uniref:hypothetical protein n=1 Tax=Streptomyces noursei TaxID=1971 RepID=UPI001675D224|nr:hypothetical protein [Streptomyces noursei]MCZ1019410.1 hypothetical protein [Streptomyces noursei]GGX08215.1 hypothetical protein GCM10010341_32350 [Streptomyces noursei]
MDESKNDQTTVEQGQTPDGQSPEVAELQAEIDKWKAMSRKNEERFKSASHELDGFRQSQMTDTEKAIEAARVEARNAALSEVGTKLVDAELRAASSAAGVNLPGAEFLNLGSFLDGSGNPDSARIEAFVSSLPKPGSGASYAQNIGLGRQGSPAAGQLTREDLSRMSPREINEARAAGKCDALLRGEI